MYTMQRRGKVDVEVIDEFKIRDKAYFRYLEDERAIRVVDKELGFALPTFVQSEKDAQLFIEKLSDEKIIKARKKAIEILKDEYGIEPPLNK